MGHTDPWAGMTTGRSVNDTIDDANFECTINGPGTSSRPSDSNTTFRLVYCAQATIETTSMGHWTTNNVDTTSTPRAKALDASLLSRKQMPRGMRLYCSRRLPLGDISRVYMNLNPLSNLPLCAPMHIYYNSRSCIYPNRPIECEPVIGYYHIYR